MTAHYIDPIEDGLNIRPAGTRAKAKLTILDRYVEMFLGFSKAKPWRRRYFIDLFAGPGKNLIEDTGEIILGSPLRVIQHELSFTNYIFIEAKPDHERSLEERLSAITNGRKFHIKCEDANIAVDWITEEINRCNNEFIKDKWPCLCFAFLDPEGYTDLKWPMIEKLAKTGKMDLMILFSISGLKRNMPNEINRESPTAIDIFFGSADWRQIYESHKRSHRLARELLNLYYKNLQTLGYEIEIMNDDGEEVLMTTDDTKAPLYYMIYACKHKLGNKFWRIAKEKDHTGQGRLF